MAHRLACVVLLCSHLLAVLASAATPAEETRRFPRLARLLLLPDEQAILKDLRDEKDRVTFQRIFWARRDPTPGTPANEFEDAVRAVWAQADQWFSYGNQKGSETGCGQVLALLGRPEEVLGSGDDPRRPVVNVTGRNTPDRATTPTGPGRMFDDMSYLREGSRQPESWVYRDRPGLPYTFTGAELRIAFDAECQYAEGAGVLRQDLSRAAAARIVRPEIGYARDAAGHLVAPSVTSAASAAVGALFATPRNDLPLALEAKLLMRRPKGDVYAAGLIRLSAAAEAGAPPARIALAIQARDAGGRVVGSTTRELLARPESDGSLLGSFGLSLKPGRYVIVAAAMLAESGKGALGSLELEVPDLAAGLAASPLVLYPDEPTQASSIDSDDPYAPLQIGAMRLRPRFGNVYLTSDALQVVATLYGAQLDAATGGAALRARYTILREGKAVARGGEDVFTTAEAVASVGPIPLSAYEPGTYLVRLDATDATAGRSLRQEASFEVRKP